jgi:hypothetical protein
MKIIHVLLLAFALATPQLPAQTPDDITGYAARNREVSYAPLSLFISGEGKIVPFDDGQMLQVGREYVMRATPDRGYVFTNWTPVILFTFTEFITDQFGNIIARSTTVASPSPEQVKDPLLRFTMQPEEVLFDSPARKITMRTGWQANFAPARKRSRR